MKDNRSKRMLKLLAAAGVLAALLLVYFILGAYNEYAEKEKAEAEKDDILFSFDTEDVDSFSYMYAGVEYSFDRDSEGNWVYRDDDSLNLDRNAVESILYNFTNVAAEQIVAEDTDSAADYGLDTPKASFTAVFKDGSQRKLSIGSENTMMDVYYAREEGQNRIFTVAPSVYQMLVPVDRLVQEETEESGETGETEG